MADLEEVTNSLKRMQEFDTDTLIRERELGVVKNFQTAVRPAQRLIDLYARLSVAALQDFPQDRLDEIHKRANADYQLFDQVVGFDPDLTTAQRDALVNQIDQAYNPTFAVLHPLIAYSLHRSADFQRLDSDARATLQAIQDGATKTQNQLDKIRDDALTVLEEVRKTAAEAGVSQQARFFKDAATDHDGKAVQWRQTTTHLAWGLGLFSVASMFIHKIPWIAPETAYDTVQIAVSKILVFAVLSYMLYLAARNFLSHKHNAIVNRHRQHALMTYSALVEAAGETPNREVVLTHAAACIFNPQPTGYSSSSESNAPSAKSVIELLGGSISKAQ